ncbi:methyltransferase [Myxococcus sp. MxC21-1]|uniref:tRNA1(Val) (adenine(37)-N6)-methyltransferase n=1 Tax=Myxococcus sp. MxC21-1 TaxID=3041439 RepID=UPI00292CB03D|nr:methyltransferase [Myxococcus sp. MxC21-1]WNZ58832.1 methyltransferase [Myxococcus sp. MxC21-1]
MAPLLLAHFAMDEGAAQRGRLMDLGTGCGIIPLVLARKLGRKDITALEVQARLFSLAERNVYLNRCEREVPLVHGDLRRVGVQLAAGSFVHVLRNPPYRTRASGRSSVSTEKAIARHELACELQDVVRAADHLLVPRGALFMVYPASRLVS